MAVMPATRIYEGTRIPSPCPTILRIDPSKHHLDDILRINFGPKLTWRMSSDSSSAVGTSRTVGIGEGIIDPR